MYWGIASEVWRANLDGSNAEYLINVPDVVWGLAIDPATATLYAGWNTEQYGGINRCNLDGSDPEVFIDYIHQGPYALDIDAGAGKIYWTTNGRNPNVGKVERATLDGTEIETLMTGIDAEVIRVDPMVGKMYVLTKHKNGGYGALERANLNGSGREALPVDVTYPGGIALIPSETPACPADLNGTGNVELGDLAILLAHYGVPTGASWNHGDLTGDGAVDADDLLDLLTVYGTECE